jgi:hypothetical protein
MTPDFETFKARWYTKYDVAINDPHLMDRGYLAVAALRDGWNEAAAASEQRIAELEAEHGPGKCVCAEPALDAMEKYDARVAELEAALGRVQDARDHIAFNIGRARLDFGDVDLYDEILNGLDAALAVPTSVPSVQRQEGERE